MVQDPDRARSEFLSAVSHELRMPLSIIKQLLMLIYDETAGPVNDRQREILVKMRHNTERLQEMIDKLLEVSRLENKKFQLRYSLVNFNELLDESKSYFEELAAKKNISLKYRLTKKEIYIFIDPERIHQVISNLIHNAVKFTEPGGRIRVEAVVLPEKIDVGVTDTGIGIRPADLSKVFDKFMQVSQRKDIERKGLGLGLSIARELVKRHGGEIWAESRLGVGSQFHFTLPRFYTANLLTDAVKDRINEFLRQRVPVHLINLLIVNYERFQRRMAVGPGEIAGEVKGIIGGSFNEFFSPENGQRQILISDARKGQYSIIFPEATHKKVEDFCDALTDRIKAYFVKHKIEDVFIAIGVRAYPVLSRVSLEESSAANLNIKEIYIGAEMRRHKRIQYVTSLEITSPAKAGELCQTFDLSLDGLCFISRRLFEEGGRVRVRFHLLKKKKAIESKGRVAWVQRMERCEGEAADTYKVGLEFVGLKENDRKLLSKEVKLYYE